MSTIGRRGRTGPRVVMSRIGMTGGTKVGRPLTDDIAVGPQNNRWMALGKCRDMDPSVFFPSDGVGVRTAQLICAECPMKSQCLEYALDNRMDDGVWGGTSERERRRILRSAATL
jgi:WhiB family redox-sensing transcriptional regulator